MREEMREEAREEMREGACRRRFDER